MPASPGDGVSRSTSGVRNIMDRADIDRVLFPAITALVAVFAFTTVPVLRFAPPESLSAAGAMLAFGAAGSWVAIRLDWDLALQIVVGAALLAGAFYMSLIVSHATEASKANDRRCIAVQRDMLSARPRRTDGPDLFQALGCRGQGEGSVYIPPPAKRSASNKSAPRRQSAQALLGRPQSHPCDNVFVLCRLKTAAQAEKLG